MNAYYTAAAWKWQPTYNYYAQNELYHHGILGQKWGQRNGPPYPLDANAHSAAEKRLKGKNDGKIESWKAKETAKVDKYYNKKIRKAQAKADKYGDSTSKRAEKARKKLNTLKAKKAIERKSIMKANMDSISKERRAIGKRFAAEALKYGVATGTKVLGSNVAAAGVALGNLPIALIGTAMFYGAGTYQDVQTFKGIRGVATGFRRTRSAHRLKEV